MAEFIEYEALRPLWRASRTRISNRLRIDESKALMLLVHFDWDETKIEKAWTDSSTEQLFSEVGICATPTTLGNCVLCKIELEEPPVEPQPLPGCGHACQFHLDQMLGSEVKQRKSVLKCVSSRNCQMKYSPDLLNEELTPIYEQSVLQSYIFAKKITSCPREECTMVVTDTDKVYSVLCPSCDKSFCPRCTEEPHRPLALCAEMLAWNCRHTTYQRKSCPQCGASYCKKGGCLHFTCVVEHCRHEFCWKCLGPWKTSHPHTSSCQGQEVQATDDIDICESILAHIARIRAGVVRLRNHHNLMLTDNCLLRSIDQVINTLELRRTLAIHLCFSSYHSRTRLYPYQVEVDNDIDLLLSDLLVALGLGLHNCEDINGGLVNLESAVKDLEKTWSDILDRRGLL